MIPFQKIDHPGADMGGRDVLDVGLQVILLDKGLETLEITSVSGQGMWAIPTLYMEIVYERKDHAQKKVIGTLQSPSS